MNYLLKSFLILFVFAGLTACVDQEFDEPPVDGIDPGLTANATVAELKNLYKPGRLTPVEQDLIIKVVVVADDRSGNYYRTIIVQDATAGIEVLINQTNAYNFYPIGRELFIKCKGLVLGEYNGVVQLGGYVYAEGGAQVLGDIIALDDHIIKGKRVGAPKPKVKAINALNAGDISTLIKLENVEFAASDVGLPYADATGRQTLNRTVVDCNGNSITLRTSGFSIFASDRTPEGNGTITAIYSVFGNTKQLYIRELSDVVMNDARCSGGGSGKEELITIKEVRDLFKSGTTSGPANRKIKGIVISDKDNNNWDPRNLVIQDATAGIAVRFRNNHNFALGQEVEVVISGQQLSEFNGLLQVNNIDNDFSKSNGAGTLPTPREATVSQVLTNLENWESTLVKIKGATIAGGTYSGSKNVTDASGTVALFTRSQASFAGQTVPGGQVDVVAVVSQFNSAQILIRNTSDVTGGTGGNLGGSTGEINETFSSQTNNQDIAIQGWTNVATKGTRVWRGSVFSGNTFAQATAFQDTQAEMETWLVTPQIDLTEAKILSFESAQAFFVQAGLSVWISTNFDGTNVASATWTQLNCKLAGSGDANYDWVQSGDVDLSAYSGKAYIGFKYTGSGANGQTTTYRIDNVKVRKK